MENTGISSLFNIDCAAAADFSPPTKAEEPTSSAIQKAVHWLTKEETRSRSADHLRDQSFQPLRARAHSHENVAGKKKRPNICPLNLMTREQLTHSPYCIRPHPRPLEGEWIDKMKVRLLEEDPYLRLLAIIDGLSAIKTTPLLRLTLFSFLAKALDTLNSDMLILFDGIVLSRLEDGSLPSPCFYLNNPETLLAHLQDCIRLSPRFVFTNFATKYGPDSLDDDQEGIALEFFTTVLPSSKCYSAIDGWQENAVTLEFQKIWNFLSESQKAKVKELLTTSSSFEALNREITDVML